MPNEQIISQSPESITVSLEWAKRLKEAGWPQEDSTFYWDNNALPWTVEYDRDGSWSASSDDPLTFAAPTAEEILRRLPDILEERYSLIIFRDYNREEKKQEWCVMYEHIPNRTPLHNESEDTLANAAASMFCYLAEHKLLP